MKIVAACDGLLRPYLDHVSAMTTVVAEQDHCRLMLPFYLPDNTQLSVYLEPRSDGTLLVTDYGETDDFLFIQGVELDSADERRRLIARRFGAANHDGVIRVVAQPGQVVEAIEAVAHAVLDTAYLVYLQRPRRQPTFEHELSRFVVELAVPYVRRPRVTGRSGRQEFDYSLSLKGGTTLMDGISTIQRDQAKRTAKLAVFKAQDVRAETSSFRFACILDDRTPGSRRAIDSSVLSPLEKWGVTPIWWSERRSAIEELQAQAGSTG